MGKNIIEKYHCDYCYRECNYDELSHDASGRFPSDICNNCLGKHKENIIEYVFRGNMKYLLNWIFFYKLKHTNEYIIIDTNENEAELVSEVKLLNIFWEKYKERFII